jgi:hypothetical protein
MLKITKSSNENGVTTFKLEGKLIGVWVHELRHCWQQAMQHGAAHIYLDLAGVTWVSEEGKALLRAMYRNGVALLAANLLLSGIVAEISAEPAD